MLSTQDLIGDNFIYKVLECYILKMAVNKCGLQMLSPEDSSLRGVSTLNFWNLSTAVTFEFLPWHI